MVISWVYENCVSSVNFIKDQWVMLTNKEVSSPIIDLLRLYKENPRDFTVTKYQRKGAVIDFNDIIINYKPKDITVGFSEISHGLTYYIPLSGYSTHQVDFNLTQPEIDFIDIYFKQRYAKLRSIKNKRYNRQELARRSISINKLKGHNNA